jgi:hypothetical protein
MLVQQLSQLALLVLGKMITERPDERLFLTGICRGLFAFWRFGTLGEARGRLWWGLSCWSSPLSRVLGGPTALGVVRNLSQLAILE